MSIVAEDVDRGVDSRAVCETRSVSQEDANFRVWVKSDPRSSKELQEKIVTDRDGRVALLAIVDRKS